MPTQKLPTDQARKLLQQSASAYLLENEEAGASVLSPAAVFPEQFYGPPRGAAHTRSEVALMRAVLEDALDCVQQQFVSGGRRTQRLAHEAEEWLFSDDNHWPCSFVNVCRALGLEPAYLRRGLKRWCQRRAAALPGRQRRTLRPRRLLRAAA
jgi:hypothetical protein